jgi:transposase
MTTSFVTPLLNVLFPPTCGVQLDDVRVEDERLTVQGTARAPTACCPGCATPSATGHSRYQRHLADLPWGPQPGQLQWTVRKFVCRNAACLRRIFTER